MNEHISGTPLGHDQQWSMERAAGLVARTRREQQPHVWLYRAVVSAALRVLVTELDVCGLPPKGMMLTRLRATLVFPSGLVAWCCCGWLVWPTGRISTRGRPLYALHSAFDAAGAARRLARSGAGDE